MNAFPEPIELASQTECEWVLKFWNLTATHDAVLEVNWPADRVYIALPSVAKQAA